MNFLILNIDYLAQYHDCVIIPGFGAFLIKNEPAKINIESGFITPPIRRAVFNSSITFNDGVLINSYKRKLSVSYEEATEVLAKDIRNLKNHLLRERSLRFGSLGLLSLTEDNKYVFRSESLQTELEKISGFYEVSLIKRAENIIAEHSSVILDDNKKSAHNLEDNKYYTFRVRKSLVKTISYAAMLAVLVMLTSLLPEFSNPLTKKSQTASSELVKPAKTTEIKKVQSVEIPMKSEEISEPTDVSLPKYHVIVATFATVKDAEKFIARNNSSGFQLTILDSPKLKRISCYSDVDKDRIREKIKHGDFSKDFPDAWVWKQN